MAKLLSDGVTLVVDRYSFSGVAFSSSKGLDLEWCKAPDSGLLAPDVVIFLKLPIEAALKRGEFGKERYEKIEIQQRVQKNFALLKTSSWTELDAARSVEELAAEVTALALSTIAAVADRPFGRLP